jgi:hypothetical protein
MKTVGASPALPFQDTEPALGRFGYSESESAFLALAALHGGYFLRRHVAEFFGSRDGGRVTQLVQKALALEHARASTWRQNVQLYHLLSRPLYAALGEPDNRNRRRHEWSQIKNRVMRLDVVLSHRHQRFLATEREKVEHCVSLGIPLEALPSRLFYSGQSAPATSRYFVDKYPLSVQNTGDGVPSHIGFTFIDEGLVGLSKFESHLASYRRLFQALKSFELVYVATTDRHFARARLTFDRFLNRDQQASLTADAPSTDQLRDYFRLRRRYDNRAFGSFDRAELIRLRDARARFSDAKYEGLFTTWLTSGDAVFAQKRGGESVGNGSSASSIQDTLFGTFRTYLLRHDYSFFGGYGLR